MKIVSWNINGLRAALDKGLIDYIIVARPDIIMLQEVKLAEIPREIAALCGKLGMKVNHNPAKQKGYSGTMCLYKQKPKKILHGFVNDIFDKRYSDALGAEDLNNEGRLITLEYQSYYVLNVYFPSYVPDVKGRLDRSYIRAEWDSCFKDYVENLTAMKPVIIGGDFNVARSYIDIYPENDKNRKDPPGFLSEGREAMENLLELGLVDAFRHLHPKRTGVYTWWNINDAKRINNYGRRLDYFLVSCDVAEKIRSVTHHADVFGSDHCPIQLIIDIVL